MIFCFPTQKMGRIQGKHIPTYYGLGRLPFTGDAFLTMSVVSGRSLFDLKESGHPYRCAIEFRLYVTCSSLS